MNSFSRKYTILPENIRSLAESKRSFAKSIRSFADNIRSFTWKYIILNLNYTIIRDWSIREMIIYLNSWLYTSRATLSMVFRYMFPIYMCPQTKVMFQISRICFQYPMYVSNTHFLFPNANDVSNVCFQCTWIHFTLTISTPLP